MKYLSWLAGAIALVFISVAFNGSASASTIAPPCYKIMPNGLKYLTPCKSVSGTVKVNKRVRVAKPSKPTKPAYCPPSKPHKPKKVHKPHKPKKSHKVHVDNGKHKGHFKKGKAKGYHKNRKR